MFVGGVGGQHKGSQGHSTAPFLCPPPTHTSTGEKMQPGVQSGRTEGSMAQRATDGWRVTCPLGVAFPLSLLLKNKPAAMLTAL